MVLLFVSGNGNELELLQMTFWHALMLAEWRRINIEHIPCTNYRSYTVHLCGCRQS
jgi:hypothetical protein